MHDRVAMMLDTPAHAATAPLDEFWEDYRADDNVWWYVSCGHHQNLFDMAMQKVADLEQELSDRRSNESSDQPARSSPE